MQNRQNRERARPARPGQAAWRRHAQVLQTLLFLVFFLGAFAVFAVPMGLGNALNTLMNTAYRLLMDTVLYIMAIAVIAGAISALLAEFGVVALLNKLLSPLMRPLFGMPGASALGIVTTYLSDNPAILTLASDIRYRKYFRAYQIPALTNLGTAFGMGLVVTTFMLGLGGAHNGLAVLCGNVGAFAGGVVSTRLMLLFTTKAYGKTGAAAEPPEPLRDESGEPVASLGIRLINTATEGGKKGVELGLGIIPGVLIFCTLIMMLTNGAPTGGVYTGGAYEGIALLPFIAEKLNFIIQPLFGFSNMAGIAVPVTALGSAGAALGVVPRLVQSGQAGANDIAVFTAMCMCWSGYLSTHISMMDVLGSRRLTGKALLSHTVGGLFAGVAAHWLFVFLQQIALAMA